MAGADLVADEFFDNSTVATPMPKTGPQTARRTTNYDLREGV
jgi:hypothetical protein